MITKEQFQLYEQVRESRAINIFDIKAVSKKLNLPQQTIKKIMLQYDKLKTQYLPQEKQIPFPDELLKDNSDGYMIQTTLQPENEIEEKSKIEKTEIKKQFHEQIETFFNNSKEGFIFIFNIHLKSLYCYFNGISLLDAIKSFCLAAVKYYNKIKRD